MKSCGYWLRKLKDFLTVRKENSASEQEMGKKISQIALYERSFEHE